MSLRTLKKTAEFTRKLTPDSKVPSVDAAKQAGDDLLHTGRYVDGIFTWILPERKEKSELIAVSPAAMEELDLPLTEKDDPEFQAVVSGQKIAEGTFPWAQNYSGWQFGQWAGQLGDGRAMSLFEVTNKKGKTYELQLKGSGLTPYSRFADGKAVLRSSIREFLGSEYVHALGIPTTRALSLTNLPETTARRETRETCAVVCRMAESWIRIGTFDNARSRKDRRDLRKLADYCIETVFKGEQNLRGEGNRYKKFYTEVLLRNASTVALWQVYGFMNGVLNTDNTSIYGLSMDYGPFAFMESFDKRYTPNHDDGTLRYSFENQPNIIWWNLIRLGEDIGELLGFDDVDDASFVERGVPMEKVDDVMKAAQSFIINSGDVFQSKVDEIYLEHMTSRFGFTKQDPADMSDIIEPLLGLMQESSLDYNLFFRRLSKYTPGDRDLEQFMQKSRGSATLMDNTELKEHLTAWLDVYDSRLEKDGVSLETRRALMLSSNPNFILRTWILDHVISQVKEGNYQSVDQVLQMASSPFNETWGFDDILEKNYTGEPPKFDRDIQCSCSS